MASGVHQNTSQHLALCSRLAGDLVVNTISDSRLVHKGGFFSLETNTQYKDLSSTDVSSYHDWILKYRYCGHTRSV